jgi:hypothetical protein
LHSLPGGGGGGDCGGDCGGGDSIHTYNEYVRVGSQSHHLPFERVSSSRRCLCFSWKLVTPLSHSLPPTWQQQTEAAAGRPARSLSLSLSSIVFYSLSLSSTTQPNLLQPPMAPQAKMAKSWGTGDGCKTSPSWHDSSVVVELNSVLLASASAAAKKK